jgi:hypothetical protein
MKRTTIISAFLLAGVFITSQATIINIPADYSTIQAGINAGVEGDTVLVQPNTYYENIIISGNNIVLGSLFLTTGDTNYIEQTVINGIAINPVIAMPGNLNSSTIITGFTLTGGRNSSGGGAGIDCYRSSPVICNNIIKMNFGSGVFCWYSNAIIKDNAIYQNMAIYTGGGISCVFTGSPVITGNAIYLNSAEYNGGGIYCQDCLPTITNNTIYHNSALYSGGGIDCYRSDAVIINSIIWENFASAFPEIRANGCNPVVCYSDICGGYAGEGNINADPLLIDPGSGNFHLQAGSPCIDAGDPSSPPDPDSTRADMGAFYYDQTTGIINNDVLPSGYLLLQNYPNPFNLSTTIAFTIPEDGYVTITIYDILGREVGILLEKYLPAGNHSVNFNAYKNAGGVYLYHLRAGEHEDFSKMTLIK